MQISLLTIKEDDEVIPYKGPLLTVEPVNKDGKLADIAPPMELGGNHTRLIALIAGAVLLGALVALGIVAWRKRKAKTAEPEPVNPYDYFSTEMEKLNPRELIEKRETEEYAYRLSLLFRQYLSYLYQVDMLELTTDEITKLFSSELKGRISTRYARGALKLMEMWDLIKFAEFDPDRELLEINLSEAGELAEKIYRGHGNNSIQQS